MSTRFKDYLKIIIKTKEEIKKNKKVSEKEAVLMKRTKDVEDSRRFASEIISDLSEYSQRKDFFKIDKSRFVVESLRNGKAEVFFLNNLLLNLTITYY